MRTGKPILKIIVLLLIIGLNCPGFLGCPVLAGESLRTPQKESRTTIQTFSDKIPKEDFRVFERTFPKPEKKEKFAPDEIIVKFKEDQKPFQVIKVPKGKVLKEVEKYKKKDNVIYAEPNYIVRTTLVPNDPGYYPFQWHLDNSNNSGINAEEAWDISTGSGVTVAVIDTGIRKGSDLINACFVSGYDFVNGDDDPIDDNGHGTHVAGTVAQSTDNDLGVAGVAFNSCLMPIKVLDKRGEGYTSDVAEGVIFAADHGAQVINLSLGGPEDSQALKDALQYASEKGVTIVAAAGNDSSSIPHYPAAYNDYVIAVGATRYDKALSYYSNYGPNIDLVAPGGDMSLDQNGDGYDDGVLQQTFQKLGINIYWAYYFFQGTSMAAPHAAGAAALLIANGNAITPDEVRAALQNTAQDLGTTGRDDIYGYGLIDAFAALQYSTETARFGFFDDEISEGNTCTAGTLDFYLNPPGIGTVFLGEPIVIDINNEDGALPFEYQVRVETFEEEGFCDSLNVLAVVDELEYSSGKLKDFTATMVISDSQDNWEFTITDSGNSSPEQTCAFEFIFEGWQEGLNFDQGFTDRESVLGTVEPADAGGLAEEIFSPGILSETSPGEIITNDYSGEKESGEELGDAATEENLEDDLNDDLNDDLGEDINEGAGDKNENNSETSSDIKDEEKIVASKQKDLSNDDDPDGDDPDDEDLNEEEEIIENSEELRPDVEEKIEKINNDNTGGLEGDNNDGNENNLNKNSVDCVQAAK